MKIIITESQLGVLRRIGMIDEEAESYLEELQSIISMGVTSKMFCKLYPLNGIFEMFYMRIFDSPNFQELQFTNEEDDLIKKYIKKTHRPKFTKFYKSHCDQFKK
jgi:hypothetical protein